jgi:L-fuconolactonase
MTAIIDAHQHVWNLDSARYDWLGPELAAINRSFELEEALRSMARAEVVGTILVQAADNAEDTAFMLSVADRHPEVVGVVAWVPLEHPDVVGHLERVRRDPRVVGIRNLIHDRPDPDWILREEVDAGLAALEAVGTPFDYVTSGPAGLSRLPAISSRHPELRIVIDHLGKPPVGGTAGARRHWRGLLNEAARNPHVFAKVSGLYPESGPMESWTPDDLRPFVEDALDVFGADRLMFGSDWPVSVLAGGYDRVWDGLARVFESLSPAERFAILGGTVTDFYRLDPTILDRSSRTAI